MTFSAKRRAAALIFMVAATGACATPPEDPAARAAFEEANDPFEPMNRQIFEFNDVLDSILFKNLAKAYRAVLPEEVRESVRNALDNLGSPVVFLNDVMQGEFNRAGATFARFAFNSTFGIGGLFDFSAQFGLPKETADFGQTLYSWGIPDGPYLVLPIFGPSNPRDAVGMATDSYIDPFRYLLANRDPEASTLDDPNVIRAVADGIDKRAAALDDLDAIRKNAVDYYAEIRSYYRQNRAQELRHGAAAPINPAEDMYQDPAKKKSPPPAGN